MNIELRAYAADEDGDLTLTDKEDADLFGIYIGDASGYEWVADFAEYENAYDYCCLLMDSEELEILIDMAGHEYCH